MVKSKKYLHLFFFTLLGLSGGSLLTYILLDNQINSKERIQNNNLKDHQLLNEVNGAVVNAYAMNNMTFPNYDLKNIFGEQINLSSILGKSKKLVLQYSELPCNICIDSTIRYFKKISDLVGDSNVILITASRNLRYLTSFIHLNNIHFPYVFWVDLNQFNATFATFPDSPCSYILNAEQNICDAFFPVKENSSLTDLYYNEMYKKYFRDIKTLVKF